jgi:hypothetical protein
MTILCREGPHCRRDDLARESVTPPPAPIFYQVARDGRGRLAPAAGRREQAQRALARAVPEDERPVPGRRARPAAVRCARQVGAQQAQAQYAGWMGVQWEQLAGGWGLQVQRPSARALVAEPDRLDWKASALIEPEALRKALALAVGPGGKPAAQTPGAAVKLAEMEP